ncbi:MAG: transglycosylase SLT domain-containing protein [Thiobacillus sp.]|nr:transglycosylase SLT domain-containing protein [Thiobacillus sp.]MDP2978894.1 transglycosylase SLT domain-containing protein [Thiobacillus sp.]
MPGIKLAGITGIGSNLISLAVLALLFSCPAHAEESGASPQTLGAHEEAPIIPVPVWHDDTASDTGNNETTAEADHNDVWQRIRIGFGVDEEASLNPLVAVHESWFAARPENVRRLAERSRPYLFHIVEELDRRDMPMEIALLPMIESAFNPAALSPSAASGIWQFIPSTGLHYGLRQDTWYDGRRDFTASTSAALDYLGKLYLDFGDWQLALAAYNCGEGCIARAIRHNIGQGLPSDYASLSLPNETRHYVPKLLALKNLIRESERYGIAIEQLPDQPYFNQVTVHASMDIHSAARLADMSSDDFIALNAAFPRKLIRSDTPVNLLVPADKANAFQRNLETGTWDTWQPYPAKKGERPAALARRFDTSLARLEEHNQLHTKNGKLVRAQTILVPVKGRGNPAARIREPAQPVRYTAKRGDTLHAIARRFDVSLGEIKAWNPVFRNSSKIRMGQAVVVRNP